jgi:alkylation response protein AidB-like acyl-CoA dehydrogenase
MTERERQMAKQAAAKLLRDRAPGLSEDDRHLLRKYPKHTLEESREIEATGPTVPKQHQGQDLGFVSGFDKILGQERYNISLGGDHA